MIYKRKLYDEMLRWKQERQGSTALLIKGARRVGKSTLVEDFAKREYKSYVMIDFSHVSKQLNSLFEDISNLDFFFLRLQQETHTTLYNRNSVIIFDEVQLQPLARQAIKHLVKDGRYDYIETGSLLTLKKNVQNILIPSEETRLTLYPLDYEEFMWATGNDVGLSILRQFWDKKVPLGQAHRQQMRDLRLYMLVGGMPQAVNDYLDTQNLSIVDQRKRSIINLYDDDFYKLDSSGVTSLLFHAIPAQLSSNASRFKVSSVVDGGRVDRLTEQIAILKDSMTTNIAYHANDPHAGLSLNVSQEQFKLFCGDTGLFVTLAFWDNDFSENIIYQKLLSDKLNTNLGYIYENIVAQMLVAANSKLFYHTWPTESGKHNYEIDFLLSRQAKLCPIEVKSSQSTKHASIDNFQKKYSERILHKYVLHTKDVRKDGDLLSLPVYMAPFL